MVFNKIGKIQNGKLKGWNIAIQNDSNGATGGYFVFEWLGNEGFDNWYESLEELLINLENFKIKWTEMSFNSKF